MDVQIGNNQKEREKDVPRRTQAGCKHLFNRCERGVVMIRWQTNQTAAVTFQSAPFRGSKLQDGQAR